MTSIRASAVVFVLALAFGTPAYAGPINTVGGTAGTIPSGASNDFVPGLFPGPMIGGYFGGQIEVDVAPSMLLIEYFGAEAGYHNEFYYDSTEIFDHASGTEISWNLSTPLAKYTTVVTGTGYLPFEFRVNNNTALVTNGANPDGSQPTVGANFFASCDPFGTSAGSGGTSCSSIYLFLDDGGAGPDDNHDDFLVRLSITAVPEPGTLGLLALGVIGLVGRRLRR